ncbi:hypothetical protein, partial [Phaeobacter sp.]|uniref:hypothetical protein n=1 Tax=Phaeobacter sp. TaxID=1902409 RepID=UPI0025E5D485
IISATSVPVKSSPMSSFVCVVIIPPEQKTPLPIGTSELLISEQPADGMRVTLGKLPQGPQFSQIV